MANGLRDGSLLSEADVAWLRSANEYATATYTDPSTVEPDCYDSARNPGARSWFKSDSVSLIRMTAGYLQLLDRYSVPWAELRTSDPGRLVYEDAVQVVAVPHSYPEHWPFPTSR